MAKAVFLDRDGVVCKEKNYLHKKEEIELLPQVAEAIQLLNQSQYKVIIVSNQTVVARGLCTLEELEGINAHLEALLKQKGASIDRTYYCPHHPSKGSVLEYVTICECRKPKPGMLYQAQKDFNLSLSESFMIGDKTSDIKAGELAGCTTILVETGYGGADGVLEVTPRFKEKDLYAAVTSIILKNEREKR